MAALKRRKSTDELVDLILKHDPNVSMERIADIISEWGDLFDDHRFATQRPNRGGHTEPMVRLPIL